MYEGYRRITVKNDILTLTRTARIRSIDVTNQLAKCAAVCDLAALDRKPVFYTQLLKRSAETEVGENYVEQPLEILANVFRAKPWHLEDEDDDVGRRTCRLCCTPCQVKRNAFQHKMLSTCSDVAADLRLTFDSK